ncbi:MAG: hypothetical protein ACKO6Q_07875 [Bacteroidota bacterium]
MVDTAAKAPLSSSSIFIPQESYAVPKHLPYPILDGGEELKLMKDGFLPIGWSRDGKFAFATEPSDEACGCYFFTIAVQDMISDKVLWSWSYSSDTEGNDTDRSSMDLRKLWKQKQAEFTRQLNRYQINPISFEQVMSLPIREQGNLFTFSLKNQTIEQDGFDRVALTKLYRKLNGGSDKVLFSNDYLSGDSYSGIMSNGICGYLRSPYESRIALLYYDKSWGYEGPPHVISVTPVGADISINGSK